MIKKRFLKVAVGIVLTMLTILALGWVGQLDHDRYIEVNLAPKPRFIN